MAISSILQLVLEIRCNIGRFFFDPIVNRWRYEQVLSTVPIVGDALKWRYERCIRMMVAGGKEKRLAMISKSIPNTQGDVMVEKKRKWGHLSLNFIFVFVTNGRIGLR
jgi:hypothetical protein